jgi:predicted aspartyl protease
LTPPEAVTDFVFEVGDHFNLDLLRKMMMEDRLVGIIAMDADTAGFGILNGERLDIVDHITSGIPGKTDKGGWSQRRYERERDMELMGLTYAKVLVSGTGALRRASLELLVDTGSVFTWIEKGILESIGVKSKGEKKFVTIEGREISRKFGEATLELEGETATRIVVFGEKGDASVLGADSLEGLGFEVDPSGKKLKKLQSFVAY